MRKWMLICLITVIIAIIIEGGFFSAIGAITLAVVAVGVLILFLLALIISLD